MISTPKSYRDIRCNITLDDLFVEISGSSTSELRIRPSGTFTANENAAINALVETLRCLSSGKTIDRHFNPTRRHDEKPRVYKCKWERSGKLRVLEEDATSKFQHANSVEEALQRKRIFTCSSELYETLPKRRMKEATNKRPPVQEESHGS